MDDMPRPRPPFLSHEVTRHGRTVWYVRRNSKRIRLRAEFGTPEFDCEYQAALTSAPQRPQKGEPAAGTLGWLIECFRGTAAYQARSASTRAKWDGLYRQAIEFGRQHFALGYNAKGYPRRPGAPSAYARAGAALFERDARVVSVGD